MIRPILAAVAILALTATAGISQSADCDKHVEDAMKNISSMKANGAKRVALARMVATGYDYCMAGAMIDAQKFFEMASDKGK